MLRRPHRPLALRPASSEDDALARLRSVAIRDEGHGYDVFGAKAEWIRAGKLLTRPLYRSWFRVQSSGSDQIPAEGGAILVANHGGTLPFDAAMLWHDVLENTARVARPIGDTFIPHLPFISTLFARVGVVPGGRANVAHLLSQGDVILIFPEGTAGIGKSFQDRYRIQKWTVGHVELAIRHRVPIIPVGIIGPEEQMPQLGRLPLHAFGLPYLPIPLSPLPLPVRYHLHYGTAIHPSARYDPKDADDPDVLDRSAAETRAAVEGLLARGLDARDGVFR